MCGFTGALSFSKLQTTLKDSNQFSIKRGPDKLTNICGSDQMFYDFWFNRLSIIDLSEKADQPMKSKDNQHLLMFNGEIYNSPTLRKMHKLKNYNFISSNSDTETLFAGLQLYGIDFINQLEGQFSFFYWNKKMKKIYLARDRIGQKPLYFSINNSSIYFASNLKSILNLLPKQSLSIDSINNYFMYGSIFSPDTLFDQIKKIEPGYYSEIDYSNNCFKEKKINYWNLVDKVDNKKFEYNDFIELFNKSVIKRTLSDVPIANFLSGGIDSTSIIKNLYSNDFEINTFSVVIPNKQYNEKKYIDEVVQKYNTNHTEIILDNKISKESILKSLNSLDEPYGDPSIVPSFIISDLISKNFKVAISGDGGDELLGGYKRIKNHKNFKYKNVKLYELIYKIYPEILGTGTNFKSKTSLMNSYLSYLSDEKFTNLLNIDSFLDKDILKIENIGSVYKSILKHEYKYYLSEQMMYKVDRTSMANSLEIRSPLVDHLLVEYIFMHSEEYFYKDKNKYPLYKFLSEDFTKEFLDRPKQGFVFDYKIWVYKNFHFIFEIINNSELSNLISLEEMKKLKYVQTRVNALRIWRVFVLAHHLNQIKDL